MVNFDHSRTLGNHVPLLLRTFSVSIRVIVGGVKGAYKTVVFNTEGSTFPHSEGEQLKRIITKLTADELIYSNPATTTAARVEAVWKRVK